MPKPRNGTRSADRRWMPDESGPPTWTELYAAKPSRRHQHWNWSSCELPLPPAGVSWQEYLLELRGEAGGLQGPHRIFEGLIPSPERVIVPHADGGCTVGSTEGLPELNRFCSRLEEAARTYAVRKEQRDRAANARRSRHSPIKESLSDAELKRLLTRYDTDADGARQSDRAIARRLLDLGHGVDRGRIARHRRR